MRDKYYIWKIKNNAVTFYYNGKKYHEIIFDDQDGDSYFFHNGEVHYIFAKDLHLLNISPEVIIVHT